MRHAVLATYILAACASATGFVLPSASARAEGGGVGGSLIDPEIGPQAEPRRGAPRPSAGRDAGSAPAIYSYPINTQPDGWAALRAGPGLGSQRLTKVYDGTLFLVVGQVPGWKLVQFRSGERGWIAERLVGCCRPASR